MAVNVPHLAVPFELGSTGAMVVEQGSPEDVSGQVQNVLAFAVGERVEAPDFGITPLQFQNAPLGLRTLMEQVARWVPRVTLEAIEEALESEQERSTTLEVFS